MASTDDPVLYTMNKCRNLEGSREGATLLTPVSNGGNTASRPVDRILPTVAAYCDRSFLSSCLVSLPTGVLPSSATRSPADNDKGSGATHGEGELVGVMPPVPVRPPKRIPSVSLALALAARATQKVI